MSELSMSMFANSADYWKARAERAEEDCAFFRRYADEIRATNTYRAIERASDAEAKLAKAVEALRFYADPFDYIDRHGLDEQTPDFYDEMDTGERARTTLQDIGEDNAQ